MTTVENLFKEARCASCLKVLPVEGVHLFRNVETPSLIERSTFCSKACEINHNTKEIADLAKACMLSMNELDEDRAKVIERKFRLTGITSKNENSRAKAIKCARCGHTWLTTSKHKMVSCPSCLGKTPNTS